MGLAQTKGGENWERGVIGCGLGANEYEKNRICKGNNGFQTNIRRNVFECAWILPSMDTRYNRK